MGGQRPRFYRGSVDSKDEDEAIIALRLWPTEPFTAFKLLSFKENKILSCLEHEDSDTITRHTRLYQV